MRMEVVMNYHTALLSTCGVQVVPGMPHGFLAFGGMASECQLGVDHVTRKIGELIRRLTPPN